MEDVGVSGSPLPSNAVLDFIDEGGRVRRTSLSAWSISASGVEKAGLVCCGPSDDRGRRVVGVGRPVVPDPEGRPGVDIVGSFDMAVSTVTTQCCGKVGSGRVVFGYLLIF